MTVRAIHLILACVLAIQVSHVRAEDQANASPAPEISKSEALIRAELPPPPAGFSWEVFKNAALLRPDGWNERIAEPEGGDVPISVYAASPEEFTETKWFETGVTLQIYSGPQDRKKVPAKKLALIYLNPFLQAHKKEDFSKFETNTDGDTQTIIIRYRDAPPGLKPVIIHKFLIADDAADSLHVFTFESPESSWQENWERYGTPIIGKIVIVPNLPSR